MITFTLKSGASFQHSDPAKQNVLGTVPYGVFMAVLETMNGVALKKATVLNDSDLSSQGRERRLQPLYESAWAMLACAYQSLEQFDLAVAQHEALMLAVPKLDTGAAAVAFEDVETRQWWRSLSLAERNDAMAEIANGGEEAATKYRRLSIALMRSPTPLPLQRETEFFRKAWNDAARAAHPDEAVAIDADHNASAWATRGIGHLHGLLAGMTGWSRLQLLNWLILSPENIGDAKALGYGVMEVAAAKQRQQAVGRVSTTA